MDQSKTELLLEYQSRIDQKARENSSDLISNGTTEHAKILITTIFGKAIGIQNRNKIFSNYNIRIS